MNPGAGDWWERAAKSGAGCCQACGFSAVWRAIQGQVIWGSLRAQHEGRWVLGKSFLRTCSWFWGFTTAALGRRRVTEALGDLAHLQGSAAGQHRGSSAPSALPPAGAEAGLAAGQAPAQCLC